MLAPAGLIAVSDSSMVRWESIQPLRAAHDHAVLAAHLVGRDGACGSGCGCAYAPHRLGNVIPRRALNFAPSKLVLVLNSYNDLPRARGIMLRFF
jgi:hypothetical protein